MYGLVSSLEGYDGFQSMVAAESFSYLIGASISEQMRSMAGSSTVVDVTPCTVSMSKFINNYSPQASDSSIEI